MRTFDNPILESKYVNIYGETIHMVLDKDFEAYISHNDCTKDFVRAKDFNFIIHEAEKIVIVDFMESSIKLIKELHK